MSTRALLIDAGNSGDRLRELLSSAAPELELDVQQVTDINAAFEDLKRQANADAPAPLILLGPQLKNPMVTARQIHQVSPLSYLVLLADGDRAVQLRQAVAGIAMIGSDWSIAHLASDDLADVLRSAVRSARHRQQLRTTLDRINVQLAAKPPAATDDQRRYMASDRFLASILENAHDAIIATDNQGTINTWNRAAEQLFGLQEQDAAGQAIHSIACGPWAEQLSRLIAQLGPGRARGDTLELECRRLDGAIFEAELVMTPIWEESGRQIGISAIVRDITERKRAEQILKHSEERVRLIIESSLDAVVMIDEQGKVTGWNPQAEVIFLRRHDEVIGLTMADLIVPERFREAHRKGLRHFLSTGEGPMLNQRLELSALRKGGEEFPIELTIAPLQLGERYQFCAFVRDITERKRLEERFRATVESAPTAMIMIDTAGTIVLVNAWTEKLFGYQREELFGQSVEVLVPERFREEHPRLRSGFFASPNARRMGAGRDLFAVRKDGSEFPVEIGLNPIQTREGTFVLSAIVDITERKQMEDALRNMNQELERRVERRTAELARSNEALERSNLELRRFAYIASHDLQSPLRSISGFVQLLQKDYQGQLDEQADSWINRVIENTTRMQTLIRDLLSYSRIDSGARPLKPTDFREVFDDAVASLEAAVHDTGAEVTCGNLPTVICDRSQLVQLLQNLIDNGIKYHGDDPPRVHVLAEKNGSEWVFSVHDNGIGIDPKHKDRIFEIFHRLHTQQAYPGTGIGLAICRRVVQRHDGRIWVESQRRKGSVFYFTLPERGRTDT